MSEIVEKVGGDVVSWPVGCVSDIAEVISGYAFKSTWFGAGTDKIIRIGDLQNGKIESDKVATFDSSVHDVGDQFKIRTGDILMAMSGATVGKISIAHDKDAGSYLNQRVVIIRGKAQETSDYLKYVFSGGLLRTLLLAAGGAAQPNLSPKDLAKMVIPLPPLNEQKRIAAILDKADSIRRKRQQAIKLADDFLRSVFLDMFGDPVTNPKGWEVVEFDHVLDAIDSGTSPKCKARPPECGEWGVLKLGAVSSCEYKPEESKAMLDGDVPNEKDEVKIGDLLFARKNTYELVAAVAIVNSTPQKLLMPDLIFRFQTNELVDKYYLWALLTHSGMRKKVQSLASGAAGSMPNISKANLKTVRIPIPSIRHQKNYKNIYNFVYKYKTNILEASTEQYCLFDSLSQKAFAGEL